MGRVVSRVWIDTDRARRVAPAWTARADAWFRARFDLEGSFVNLQLTGGCDERSRQVLHQLAAASTELWVDASFVWLVLESVESSDRFDLLDPVGVLDLRVSAGAFARRALPSGCAGAWVGDVFSSRFGDVGQTYAAELRSPYSIAGSSTIEGGRNLVLRALADTDDQVQIRQDEFELVRLAGGRFLVVLPGVTDLSGIELGLDDHHRTVRDVDQFAYSSSRSASVEDNRYAQMVAAGLRAAGVPIGAPLMIVGHSYGADTALDLASDRRFNGAAGFNVTHVVAAGYHSTPQLAHVDPRTEVLVLQNYRDVAVIAESIGYGSVTEALDDAGAALDDVLGLDPLRAGFNVAGAVSHAAAAAAAAAQFVAGRSGTLGRVAIGVLSGRPGQVVDAATDVLTLQQRVERVADRQVVDVFRGGSTGVGHAPANYLDHVATTRDPDVQAFFESVAAAGYATSGTAWAIDVSVPPERDP